MPLDFNAPQYSLAALLAALAAGFVIGRITAGRHDPRRAEAKRKQGQIYQQELRDVIGGLSLQTASKVRQHVSKGELIQAIKLVRDETGCGLKEAKDAVEQMPGQKR